jgi:hypothetical protein
MPDLASMLVRRSVGALPAGGSPCSECQRTPLPGEALHELGTGQVLCDLCFAALPDADRVAVRSERVRVAARPLAVVAKPA